MSIKDTIEKIRRLNDSKDRAFVNGWNGACDAIFGALSTPEPTEGLLPHHGELLAEINKCAHAAGTNAYVRDVLKRSHRAIRESYPARAMPLQDHAEGWKPIIDPDKSIDAQDCEAPIIIGWWSLDHEWCWVPAFWTGEEWQSTDNSEIAHCKPTHWLRPRSLPLPADPMVAEEGTK